MKTRLKLKHIKPNDPYPETYVQGQIKTGFFWETVISMQVTHMRDVEEAKEQCLKVLRKYKGSGFNEKGEIEL